MLSSTSDGGRLCRHPRTDAARQPHTRMPHQSSGLRPQGRQDGTACKPRAHAGASARDPRRDADASLELKSQKPPEHQNCAGNPPATRHAADKPSPNESLHHGKKAARWRPPNTVSPSYTTSAISIRWQDKCCVNKIHLFQQGREKSRPC